MSTLLQKPKPLNELLQNAPSRRYANGHVILNEGDTPKSLYYIVEGSVSVSVEGDDGHSIVLTYLNAGDFFGEMGLFADEPERSACVTTRADCKIAEVSYAQFRNMANEDPNLIFSLAGQLSKRLRKTNDKVLDLAFIDVSGRVAHALLNLAKEPDALTHPRGMQIKSSRQEIARIVGCSREMAGRVLKDLEQRELIEVSGKTIVIKDIMI